MQLVHIKDNDNAFFRAISHNRNGKYTEYSGFTGFFRRAVYKKGVAVIKLYTKLRICIIEELKLQRKNGSRFTIRSLHK